MPYYASLKKLGQTGTGLKQNNALRSATNPTGKLYSVTPVYGGLSYQNPLGYQQNFIKTTNFNNGNYVDINTAYSSCKNSF